MHDDPPPMTSPAARLLDKLAEGGIRPGLETTRRHLEVLGRPQEHFESVVVAGTNGKGSCAAVLAAIAAAAGYRVGLYTSPHLEEHRERIRIDGEAIDGEHLVALVEEIFTISEEASEIARPTSFETLTLAALLHFARRQIDLAVLEVGMGGRLDAVNVVDPLTSVVTDIAVEHARWLGTTVGAITGEKVAVARRGRPIVFSLLGSGSGATVEEVARERGAEPLALGREAEVETLEDRGLAGQRIAVDTGSDRHELETSLPGEHQARNVALAVVAAGVLGASGFPAFDPRAVEAGVRRCRWPGRLEEVSLPEGAPVILDCAHNPSAVAALVEFLAEHVPKHDLLFGCLAGKEVDGMLPALTARADRVTLTEPVSDRALSAASLRELAGEDRGSRVGVEPRLCRALETALRKRHRPLVVTGSLALVGPVRGLLRERFGIPPPATDPLF